MFDKLSVRMYHVGFGDCFLVRLWEGDRAFRILIDCGSITQGAALVGRVVDDVIKGCTDEDGVARIPLVVATHRHKDHVGGFANPAWAAVEVNEVWMPWTEDFSDPEATRIRNRQSALALALCGGDSEEEPLASEPEPKLSGPKLERRAFGAMAINALTNEKAMATLHEGFAGDPKRSFLPKPDTAGEIRTLADAPGLKIHVLGPPRTEAAMKAMDPPSGAGYFTGPSAAGGAPVPAFDERWQIDAVQFGREAGPDRFRPDDKKKIDALAEQPFGALAAALDKAVNNTSLILMFEVGSAMLLFPGDAQWGAWEAMMADPKARALLARTSLYKVGHHGSHNATPKAFIEEIMPTGGVALFSTATVKQWKDIPRPKLVEAVAARAERYARTDQEAETVAAGFTVEPGLYTDWETELA